MAFGQQSGPPATARQVEELLRLLHGAGHSGFRDARGPLGFNQRQAGGRFTRDEAEELISRLQEAEDEAAEQGSAADAVVAEAEAAIAEPAPRMSGPERALRRLPTDQLVAELRRRGWTVTEP
jgi:hypothetical protein